MPILTNTGQYSDFYSNFLFLFGDSQAAVKSNLLIFHILNDTIRCFTFTIQYSLQCNIFPIRHQYLVSHRVGIGTLKIFTIHNNTKRFLNNTIAKQYF